MRAAALALISVTLLASCDSAQAGDAEVVATFFAHLERGEFDAAVQLLRDADGAALSAASSAEHVDGWRRAYAGYSVHFTRVVVDRVTSASRADIARAHAIDGFVESVHFEGTSTSPCVPIGDKVLPGTSQPVALHGQDGAWFLLGPSMVGFIHTCPGA
jgi:hypothetical protein